MRQMSQGMKPTWRRRVFRVLLFLAVPYVLVCAGCASFQRKLIYFPPVFDQAEADRMGASENLQRWNAPAGPVGWERPAPIQPARGKVLVLHGNGGAAVACGHYADAIQQAATLDVFIVEYPGYADRPGKPTERSLDESADAAFGLLSADGPVYLVGESLGTGVACWLAGKHPDKVAGLVLLAPFNSLTDVAQYHMPLLPVHLMLVDRFRSEKYLRDYAGPISVMVGGNDPVVP